MDRIKLFSKPDSSERIKLFCDNTGGVSQEFPHWVRCQDCGYKFETTAATTNLLCPKCGGHRFNVISEAPKVEKTFSEEELFQKEFNETEDKVELKLKEFSGSSLSAEDFQKEFGALGITAGELEEKNFAETMEDGSVKISEDSFMQSRLFSKIIISVTKTLELDPTVTMSAPEVGIEKLEEVSDLCPKSIAIIKKIHGVGTDSNSKEDWMTDSGIKNDLVLEFGGQLKPKEELKTILDDRYPDAPDDLISMLKEKGIIKEVGDELEIIK